MCWCWIRASIRTRAARRRRPRRDAAVAKFAAAGKPSRKKDLGMLAVSYGNVYVAQIAMGANPRRRCERSAKPSPIHGPSLILAYSHASPTASI